jgi:hypothetical protein
MLKHMSPSLFPFIFLFITSERMLYIKEKGAIVTYMPEIYTSYLRRLIFTDVINLSTWG